MTDPRFQTPITNPFGLTRVEGFASPTFADIDGDGDLDAFVGERYGGSTLFYRNEGSTTNPVFAAPSTNPFGLTDVGAYASPTLVDIDGDGDLDAFVGEIFGSTLFYRNEGSTTNPVFAAPSTNPFGLTRVGYWASPTFADIDGDGDLDAFVGNRFGDTLFYRNEGSATNPVFAAPSTNPFGLTNVGQFAAPTFADIDGDGDLDAMVGERDGNTLFYRNTGSTTNPVFAAPSTNPFGLTDVGFVAAPTFADIDGDGDLDAFVGNNVGDTLFFLANFAPVVSNPVTTVATEDNAPFNVNLLEGASDPDKSDTLSISNLVLTSGTDAGITVNGNSLNINPNAYNSLGVGQSSVINYSYNVIDGKGGTTAQTATITITGVNDAPVVSNPVTSVVSEDDAPSSVNLLEGASDPDTDDTLSISNLVLTNGNDAGITINGNSLNINPNAYNSLKVGQSSVINYSYNVTDGKGGTTPQTATLTITGVNDAPDAQNDNYTTKVNTPIIIPVSSLLANDSDIDGDSLTITSVLNPSNGTATLNNNGTPDNPNDDKIVFTPTLLFTGNASFDYTVSDGSGGTDTATVAIVVQGNLNGTPNSDILIGNPFDDSMNGLGADDFIDGRAGNDTIDGGTGNNDWMFGDAGNDTITDPDGVLGAHGGTGNDTINVTFAPSWRSPLNQVRSDGKITGGFGDDNITVTMNNSSFFINLKGDEPTSNQPQDGNDVITLLGTYANSVVDMGGGNDTFNGGIGRDNVSGQNGNDLLNGNDGNDGLNGGNGRDILLGGAGNDNLTGGNDDDLLVGGLGSDTLNGGLGSDRIIYNTLGDRGNLASGDTINEFVTSSDAIDLTRLMPTLTGYSGDAGGYVRFTQSGSNALLQIDADGGGNSFVNLATLTNVSASGLLVGSNVIV